jgi:hypothetical membrane protein
MRDLSRLPWMKDLSRFHWFGTAAAISITFVSVTTALFYKTPSGAAYSPINHFISELGWVGHSPLAGLFNAGLIISGLLLGIFFTGLGLFISNIWAKIGMAAGWATGLFISLVGIFPMNHLLQHVFVSDGFFRAGLASVIFFAIAVLAQPQKDIKIPRSAGLFSLPTILVYVAFIILMSIKVKTLSPSLVMETMTLEPPPFQLLAVLEWAVFFFTTLWFLGMALSCSMFNRRAR